MLASNLSGHYGESKLKCPWLGTSAPIRPFTGPFTNLIVRLQLSFVLQMAILMVMTNH